MKILWLSRHPMTSEQKSDIERDLGDVEVVHLNITFWSQGCDAFTQLVQMGKDHGVSVIAGVFPAHIAAYTAVAKSNKVFDWDLMIPVSVPAPAVDGETRGGGFVFSHWERF